MEAKPGFDAQYYMRMLLVIAVFLLNLILSSKIGLNDSLLVVNAVAIISTLTLWSHDGLLRIDLRLGYVLYYLALFAASAIAFPNHTDQLLSLLYRNGFREEVLFRLFMVGIFHRYNTPENEENKRKLTYAILVSNTLFMVSHPYNWVGLASVFVFGIVFTMTYVQGGLPSAIIAHTLYNFYQTVDHNLLSLLLILPLVKSHLSPTNLTNKVKEFIRLTFTGERDALYAAEDEPHQRRPRPRPGPVHLR
jgi:hypothetical protein